MAPKVNGTPGTSNLHAALDEMPRKAVEPEKIYGVKPSHVYAAWRRLRAGADRSALLWLTSHEKPAVRLYAAREIIETMPEEASVVYPLLADQSAISLPYRDEPDWLADLVLSSLCDRAPAAPIDALLLRAAADPALGPSRASALVCVAGRRRAEAAKLARELLRSDYSTLRAGAIEALGRAGTVEDGAALAALVAGGGTTRVRWALARALGDIGAPDTLPALAPLLADAELEVRGTAMASYILLGGADRAVFHDAFAVAEVGRSMASELARHPEPRTLALVKEYIDAFPREGAPLAALTRGAKTPEVTELIRWALRRCEPDNHARSAAIEYLRDVKDRASIPLFRQSLRRKGILGFQEKIAAAKAIAALGGPEARAAVGDLEALLDDHLAFVVVAAAEALVELGSTRSVPLMQRAADRGSGWGVDRLRELIRELTPNGG